MLCYQLYTRIQPNGYFEIEVRGSDIRVANRSGRVMLLRR